MDIHKLAAWAQVLSFPTGAYCAYGTYVNLHPGDTAAVIFNSTAFAISFGAFATCLVIMLIGKASDWRVAQRSKLTIHSAVYGTGSVNDIDVTGILQNHTRNALAVPVDDQFFGRDPAPGAVKRLEVEYSYGNPVVLKISRPEYERIVIPEDSWAQKEIKRLTQHLAMFQPTSQPLPVTQPIAAIRVPQIWGEFSNVKILSHGVITKNMGQRWMKCGFDISVSLSSSRAVHIDDIKLRTHRNFPPCLSLSPSAKPQISELDGVGNWSFAASPQIEYLYDGSQILPESLDMIVVDEFGAEHEIYLKRGQTLPTLPGAPSSAEAL